MELSSLNVLHWRGSGFGPAMATGAPEPHAFCIDTCQRRVNLLLGTDALEATRLRFPADGALEHFAGTAAYAFLLRCCCGLESKLVAETEIFGQIKQAWRTFSQTPSALAQRLSPWMQQLFQDAKAIRAQHLANLGSASYGSQVRRLLGEQAGAGPTLLIGAGQLAQSVAPWLTGAELWLWNRTPARARELARELSKRAPNRPVRVIEQGVDAELAAWRQASPGRCLRAAGAPERSGTGRCLAQPRRRRGPAGASRRWRRGRRAVEGLAWLRQPRHAVRDAADPFGCAPPPDRARPQRLRRKGAAALPRGHRLTPAQLGRSRRLQSRLRHVHPPLKLGTRRSALARAQSAAVARRLERLHQGLTVELVGIDTRGDRIQDRPLSSVDGKEFFTAEIDNALLEGAIDFTVHSYKDLSLERTPRLRLAAVPQREQPHDIALFAADLPARLAAGGGITLGSSSPRRMSLAPDFLRQALPHVGGEAVDMRLVELRGNVDSRLRRLHEPRGSPRQLDGIVLAFAGLARLWADEAGRALLEQLFLPLPRMLLPLSVCPAAPAQGALGVECRAEDGATLRLLQDIDHAPTRRAIEAERALLAERGGGCHQTLRCHAGRSAGARLASVPA